MHGASLQCTDGSQVLGSGYLAYTVTWSSLALCVHCPMICRISAILRYINFIRNIKTSKEEDFFYILWRRKCIMKQSFLLKWNSNETGSKIFVSKYLIYEKKNSVYLRNWNNVWLIYGFPILPLSQESSSK